jgi:hypothetical protein
MQAIILSLTARLGGVGPGSVAPKTERDGGTHNCLAATLRAGFARNPIFQKKACSLK